MPDGKHVRPHDERIVILARGFCLSTCGRLVKGTLSVVFSGDFAILKMWEVGFPRFCRVGQESRPLARVEAMVERP